MSVSAGRGKLYAALKDLRVHWARVREQWDDSVTRGLEEQFWQPLEASAVAAVAAMDHLGQVLRDVRQECGEDGTGSYDEDASE